MKIYVVRRSYGDFDTYYDEPVAAWLDKNQAEIEKTTLNEKLGKAKAFYNEYIKVSARANRKDAFHYCKEAEEEARKILPDFNRHQNAYFMEEVELYGDLKNEK